MAGESHLPFGITEGSTIEHLLFFLLLDKETTVVGGGPVLTLTCSEAAHEKRTASDNFLVTV
jgi:hypothetical protein